MKKLTLFLLCCICTLNQTYAQRDADLAVQFDKNIETILLNPFTGCIIVKEKDVVQSYNPETNNIEWRITKDELIKANKLGNALDLANNNANADLGKQMEKKKDEIKFIPTSSFL